MILKFKDAVIQLFLTNERINKNERIFHEFYYELYKNPKYRSYFDFWKIKFQVKNRRIFSKEIFEVLKEMKYNGIISEDNKYYDSSYYFIDRRIKNNYKLENIDNLTKHDKSILKEIGDEFKKYVFDRYNKFNKQRDNKMQKL